MARNTRLLAAFACAVLAMPVATANAQPVDDDYVPLGSRIPRDRQFPTDLFYRFDPGRWSDVQKDRSRQMMSQFGRCLYRRSKENSHEFLEKTDLGFTSFEQIGQDNDKAARVFGIMDCLGRVADSQNSGVQMRWTAPGIRQMLLQEAYFDEYPEQPSWAKPGYVVDERTLPLSGDSGWVIASLDIADCVVVADPYSADFFFRTPSGSPVENEVLRELVPAIGPCLPEGLEMQIEPTSFRTWIGEALWHAANHNSPAPAEAVEAE